MEKISSRKNEYIRALRALGGDSSVRRERGEFLCEGRKTLLEALAFGACVSSVLWRGDADEILLPEDVRQYVCDGELFDYACPMKNSPGPLFTVKIPPQDRQSAIKNAVILESVQDPGNVGTVIRTANAFSVDAVILTGECADLYNVKTVRATMGAVFRQRVMICTLGELAALLKENALPLYGAALTARASDVRAVSLKNAAVAVGSEGSGLSRALLDMCESEIIIPMAESSESLNAAVAAAVLMWEMAR